MTLIGFGTPRRRNVASFARLAALLPAAFCVAVCFTASAFGQGLARPDGSIPVPVDWSSKRVLFTAGYTPEQAAKMRNEPRVYAEWLHYGNAPPGIGLVRSRPTPPRRPRRSRGEMERDWAVSLGAGGVAPGMSPAKYTFNVNAAPSCASDFVVFPINTSTGNTRANVVGTFTGEPVAGNTTSITITPTGGAGVTLTLTASAASNTGLNFQVSATIATNATNLAAAINRNLSGTALDRAVAVASGVTVTVYALTPGNRVTLTDANTLNNFSWGAVTAGTNGGQANIVALNQLYSGAGTPLCGVANPEFIFSYASGVGPVATSPSLSLSGKKISYVENDPNIGAILHVLTFGTGSTEFGAACAGSNNGASMPTCATDPVIPGSTANSTATDFMLPLGLVAANAATAVAGATDSFSSPFTDYANDTTFVGDDNGYLYSIQTTFTGTPAHAGGNFPVQVSPAPGSTAVTRIRANAAVVTVTAVNTLSLGELVTISGVAVNNATGCTAADVAVINGVHTVATATAATFTFNAAIPNPPITGPGTGCNVAAATITPGSNYLSAPVVDVSGTGNIFVGDSSANLYELTQAGAMAAASLPLGLAQNGGIRDAPIIDSTNKVGYVATACSNNTTGGETDTTNSALIQFTFTSSTLTSVAVAGLDSGANQSCSVAGFPIYDATPDYRYFALGISSATAANNGEIIAASSGTGGQQIKTFQFVSSVLQTTPEGNDKPQLGTGASVVAPLTEFLNFQAFSVTGVTATTTVVTVTAANILAAGDTVTLTGVTANTGNGCTAADVAAINGIQTVATATAANFTFNATIPSATSGTGCTVTGATAGADYMFMGVYQNPTELYSFLLPATVLVPGLDNPPIPTATNTADIAGGTSAIIVDNDSTAGQASSLYFGTLATSTTICGATAAYCAVKLTQAALQ
jgi:hypothetical protein